jgi:hypothetical protein
VEGSGRGLIKCGKNNQECENMNEVVREENRIVIRTENVKIEGLIRYKMKKLMMRRKKDAEGGRIRKERRDESKFEEKIAEQG